MKTYLIVSCFAWLLVNVFSFISKYIFRRRIKSLVPLSWQEKVRYEIKVATLCFVPVARWVVVAISYYLLVARDESVLKLLNKNKYGDVYFIEK